MEPHRFDALARSLTTESPSRRMLLQIVAGGLAVAGLAKASSAAAKPRKKKKCKNGLTRCGKKCVDLNTNAKNCGQCKNSCAFEIECVGGTCQCLALNADCSTDGQCCSGRCSIEVITTCRKSDCADSGPCADDSDCCGGFCVATGGSHCCQGIC